LFKINSKRTNIVQKTKIVNNKDTNNGFLYLEFIFLSLLTYFTFNQMIMKRTIVYILAVSIVSFSSCKQVNKWLGKTSMSQEEIDALVTQNDELQKQVKEDAAAYERELDALRTEYEQKLAAFETSKAAAPASGFFVVVGSFKNQKLADDYASKIKSMGYEGNIVDGPSSFKLVTASTHANLKEALQALKTARSVVASKSWIYFK